MVPRCLPIQELIRAWCLFKAIEHGPAHNPFHVIKKAKGLSRRKLSGRNIHKNKNHLNYNAEPDI